MAHCSCKSWIQLSLSTVVLNSRDWSEIVWLPKILHFKNQPCNSNYPKKPAGMHWLGYNDAVFWLNEGKTQIFQPTANFENFKTYPYFVCQPASLPACLPAIRPSCARCRAPEISHDKGNGGGFTKMLAEDDLPTAPWQFLLSFFPLPCSSLFL